MARILVVDDEPDVRELFNITLKMAGHTTETAKDGVEAVDKLKENLPDLILLDLMMPRMDGFGLLSHIRQEMDSKPVRVLVATAKVLEDADHEKLNSWPVVGVLNKGELDIGQMVVIVSSALSEDPMKNGSEKPEPVAKAKTAAPDKEVKTKAVVSSEAKTSAAQKEGSEPSPEPEAKKDKEADKEVSSAESSKVKAQKDPKESQKDTSPSSKSS